MLKTIKFFLLGLLFVAATAQATLELELTQGVDSALPIAIIPFAGQQAIDSDNNKTSNIISKDLQNSGHFRLLDTASASDVIDYNFWRAQKADGVVTGQITKTGSDQYKISFKLYDIFNKSVLLDKQFDVKTNNLRALAHHISDLIYQQLVGERGIFSTKIAYVVVQRQGPKSIKYNLNVADADGFNQHTLLTSNQPLMSPAWSPDGKNLAYVSFEGNRAAIFIQNVASGTRRTVAKYPGINGAPAWSPDGRKMALVLTQTGYPKIYILDLAANSLEQITSEWYLDTEPNWAPDGQSLIFTSNRGGNPQIYRINLADKKIQRVTYQGNYNARASFASDGKGFALLHQDGNLFSIGFQDLDSGRVNVLTKSGFDESPSIAPNGKMIVYATNYNGRGVLAEVSTDGKVKLLLPSQEGEVQEPSWSPYFNNN